MSRQRLTGKRAVWLGLVATPALLIAAIMLIGVTAGSAGPSTSGTPAATAQATSGVISHTTALGAGTQTLAQLRAFWTPERMASAQPRALGTSSYVAKSEGSVETIAQASTTVNLTRQNADGSVSSGSVEAPGATGALTEPFHGTIPFSQWQYFAKYLPNTPGGGSNVAASAQHKMFFVDGGSLFVCSSSTIGVDGVWTAGHCVSDGAGTFVTEVMFCPSYDNGAANPTAGCWGAAELWVSSVYHTTGNFDHDMGGADATDTPISGPQTGMIGAFTGILGLAHTPVAEGTTASPNFNFVSFGYPQAAPFNGNKIQVCTSSLGYVDDATAGGQASVAIGCDMTGGSSGGPWILSMGSPGQPGGGGSFATCCNFVGGHNDWRHTAIPGELNSPPYNCLAIVLYRSVNDIAAAACP